MKLVLVLAVAVACVKPAHATISGTVYMADSGGEFGTLDPTTGVFNLIVTEPVTLAGLGFATDGTLYGVEFTSNPNAAIYRINPATGGLTLLGTVTETAFGATVGSDDLVYVMGSENSAVFYTVNPTTLAVHVINASTGILDDGLAAILGGQFYTSQFRTPSLGDLLERIDPVSGLVTQVGSGLGFSSFAGANIGGVLYSVGDLSNGSPVLETINTSTGTGSEVTLISGISGAPSALALQTPEPATWWMGLLGLFVLLGRRTIAPTKREPPRI